LTERAFWLLKSEPEVYPFSQLVAEKKTLWEGVRNHEARNNLAKMAIGDLVLFYHSHDAEVVGVARVSGRARRDPTSDDPRWVAVEIEAVEALKLPVSLAAIRADPTLATLKLVTHSRLSVLPVEPRKFERILELGRTKLPRRRAVRPAKAVEADEPG
jgi:predicted RNA-binding protein with PUA-like domain